MSSESFELPARRLAWLADGAYQVRLTEQARTLAAAAGNIRPSQLHLDAASKPDTHENAQVAEHDNVQVRCTVRALEVPAGQAAQQRRLLRATRRAAIEPN